MNGDDDETLWREEDSVVRVGRKRDSRNDVTRKRSRPNSSTERCQATSGYDGRLNDANADSICKVIAGIFVFFVGGLSIGCCFDLEESHYSKKFEKVGTFPTPLLSIDAITSR